MRTPAVVRIPARLPRVSLLGAGVGVLMRFLVTNLHRAFPELDPFPDPQAIGYVNDAYRQSAGVVRAWSALGFVVACVGCTVTCPVSAALFRAYTMFVGRANEPSTVGLLLLLLPGWFISGWSAFALRDRGLRRAIRKRLEGARCTACHYSLLGLLVRDGRVRCPECGHEEQLAARGLSAADILGVAAQDSAGSAGVAAAAASTVVPPTAPPLQEARSISEEPR